MDFYLRTTWILIFLPFLLKGCLAIKCEDTPCDNGGACEDDWNDDHVCRCTPPCTGEECGFCYTDVTPPCFPNLELISAVQPGTTMTIFTDIKIACHASVWAISLYSMAAGTVWVDIWRPISHSHYILEGTVEIVTSDVGVMNVTLAQPLPVQPGYVIGYHCSSSETVPVSRTAGGVSSVLVFTEVHESGMFTKGLRTDDTNLVSTQTVDATLYTPHLDLHLANATSPFLGSSTLSTGSEEPDSGLSIFPDFALESDSFLRGVSFDASETGTFWVDLFRPDPYNSSLLELVHKEKMNASTIGQQHHDVTGLEVTFRQGDILGIHNDDLANNPLFYVGGGGPSSQLLIPKNNWELFPYTVVNTDQATASLNNLPPLKLVTEKGVQGRPEI